MKFTVKRNFIFGKQEKHEVLYLYNSIIARTDVIVDRKIIFTKFGSLNIDKVFEVGNEEKHRIRIKQNFGDWLKDEVIIEIDGLPADAAEHFRDLNSKKDSLPEATARINFAGIVGIITIFITTASFLGYISGPSQGSPVDIMMLLGFVIGLFRKSRFCAVCLFLFFLLSKILTLPQLSAPHLFGFIGTGFFFCFAFYYGVVGTFAYHRIKKTRFCPKHFFIKLGLAVFYGALSAFFAAVGYFYNTPESLPDNSLVGPAALCALFGSLIPVFAGGFPWTGAKPLAIEPERETEVQP